MPWSVSDLPDSVKNKTWSAHQKEIFVHAANAALKEYGDDGKAIAVGTAAADHAEEKKNASQMPKIFYCKHMMPGIVGYENENILVDADAMKQSAPSMVGKPIYVQHQKVDLANLHEADGFVVECFYNELDGWLWAKMLIISDEGQKVVANGWSVSNAYVPVEWSESGQHLNVDYDRKIRNYEFTHLAIVPNPRYEEAKIFTPEEYKAYQAKKKQELDELQNSKPIKSENGIMFFRNNKQEIKAGDTILDTDFTEITNADGSKEIVSVGDLKKAKEEANKLAKENAKKNEKMVDDDEEVEVDGEKVNMGELKKCYTNMKKNSEKKNEETPEAKKAREELENAEAEEKKKAEEKAKEEEKENAKRFQEFLNAGGKNTSKPKNVETQMDKLKRGQDRY